LRGCTETAAGPFDFAHGKLSTPRNCASLPRKSIAGNSLAPTGLIRYARAAIPGQPLRLRSRLPWAILDGSLRELRCPDGVLPLVELRWVGQRPWVHGIPAMRVLEIPAMRANRPSVSDTLFHFRYFRHEKLRLPGSQHLPLSGSAVQSEHESHTRLEARACFKRPIPQGAQCPQPAIRTSRASCP
jgi:hypothetical protein